MRIFANAFNKNYDMDYLPKDPAILPPEGRSVARNLVSSVNLLSDYRDIQKKKQ